MKKYIFFLFVFLCCTTKNQNVKHNEEITIEEDNFVNIYYRLIDGIKNRDYDKISSCYSENALYIYDENTDLKYKCFNKEKEVDGNENIVLQYKYLFKSNILDRIEYEIISIDKNSEKPIIKFINVWQNSDDDIIEIIEFEKINNKYYISKHTITKKE